MSTHNVCLRAKIRKKCISLYTPNFTIYKLGARGLTLHEHDVSFAKIETHLYVKYAHKIG